MQDGLEEGSIVRLGDLGSLCISISSTGEYTEKKKCFISLHKRIKMYFTPGKELKKMLKNLDTKK